MSHVFQHVALCPWFAETAIVDQTTKEMVMAKSPIKFVSVERVGEAFELAAKEQRYQNRLVGLFDDIQYNICILSQLLYLYTCSPVHRSGGLIAVLPNTPLVYYPDILQETGLIVYLLSKV